MHRLDAMDPRAAVVRAIRRTPDYRGRAGLAEYWWFVGLLMLLTFASRGADALAGNHLSSIVTSGLLAVPALSVTVRRFHDTGHSAWALLAGLVPVLGEFWALFWLVHARSPGANEYGPPTQAVSPGAAAPAFVPQVRPRRRTYIDADGNVTRQEFG